MGLVPVTAEAVWPSGYGIVVNRARSRAILRTCQVLHRLLCRVKHNPLWWTRKIDGVRRVPLGEMERDGAGVLLRLQPLKQLHEFVQLHLLNPNVTSSSWMSCNTMSFNMAPLTVRFGCVLPNSFALRAA